MMSANYSVFDTPPPFRQIFIIIFEEILTFLAVDVFYGGPFLNVLLLGRKLISTMPTNIILEKTLFFLGRIWLEILDKQFSLSNLLKCTFLTRQNILNN